MACFLVPTGEAIVASIVKNRVAANEDPQAVAQVEAEGKVPWSKKLKWLTTMLWGGALLLCLEHMWHGEVVPWPPFLTAMGNPADTAEMLAEMSTVGVGMAVLVTVAWVVMVLIADNVPAITRRLQGSEA